MAFINMANLKEYIHEESFGALAQGNEIIEEALRERDEAIKLTREILERLDSLDKTTTRYCKCIEQVVDEKLSSILVDSFKSSSLGFKGKFKDIKGKIDKVFWENIMASSKLEAVMHNAAKKAMKNELITRQPEFDRDHVYSTLDEYMNNRIKTFVVGAISVFENLDMGFKSNDGILFRKKIIFGDAFCSTSWNTYSDAMNQIADIERIFVLLDGKDPSQMRRTEKAITLTEDAKSKDLDEIDLSYFSCILYKKGSVHLIFSRRDLVDKLNNQIANHYGEVLGKRESVH
jgi:hypothetical protein